MTGAEVQTVTELINWDRVTNVGLLLTFIAGLKLEWWYMAAHVQALKKVNEDLTAMVYALHGLTERSVESANVLVLGQTGQTKKRKPDA